MQYRRYSYWNEETVMKPKNRGLAVISAVGLLCMLGSAQVAMADALTVPGSPSAQNEGKGTTTGLGSSHRFSSAAEAASHCGNSDPVVWSDGYHLTYDLPGSQAYGKAKANYGFYACKSEADSAGFQVAPD
jgi:hypothetical protein